MSINYSSDGDKIVVCPGIYAENINFYGKEITLSGKDPNDLATVQATIIWNRNYLFGTIRFESYESSNSVLTGFTVQSTDTAGQEQGIGVYCYYSSPLISNNVIKNHFNGVYGESAAPTLVWNHIKSNVEYGVWDCDGKIKMCAVSGNGEGGLKFCDGEVESCSVYENDQDGLIACNAAINNCVIRNNIGNGLNSISGEINNCTIVSNGEDGFHECTGTIKNCIVTFNNHYGFNNCSGSLEHNNVWNNGYGGYGGGTIPGPLDTHNDPLFVDVSHNDYHLQSEIGHWHTDLSIWAIDDLTSTCIDAGDPCDPTAHELYPNGDIINQGVYGGTPQASKSPNGQTVYCDPNIPGDVSENCTIDLIDYSIIAGDWLENNIENQEVFSATEVWAAFYDGVCNQTDGATAIAVDSLGNVYVTGYSDTKCPGKDNAFTTIKYSPNGSELWVALYQMYNYDTATDIAVDDSGNVYITGSYYNTIKYDANGNELWMAHYNNGREAKSIVVDDHGYVYITGESISGTSATVKYDTNGIQQTAYGYGDGVSFDLAVDESENVYVVGYSYYENPTGYDFITVKYSPNGNTWVAKHSGAYPSHSPPSIAIDGLGNVYMTCLTGTVKYDSNGNELWVNSTWGKALVADNGGNLYVTGVVNNNYSTRKFDSNGNILWIATYDGANNNDYPTDIALDGSGVYVTGWCSGSGYNTVKYDPNGNELWVVRSDAYSGDYSPSMALDKLGDVYVTGRKYFGGPGGYHNFATFKYEQHVDMVEVCTQSIEGDTNGDCKVNFVDFVLMVDNWLECNLDPPEACWQ